MIESYLKLISNNFSAWLRSTSSSSAPLQCHVFWCLLPGAVNKIFVSFAKAFKKPWGEPTAHSPQTQHEEEHIMFEVGLEIREDDGKGNFVYVPQ